ncbi:MAG: DMT family transporter [Lachnospiraceae bacterium]
MSYVFLFGAIAAEVFATTMIKFADGFTKVLPTVLCVVGYVFCYYLFGKAVEKINLAAAYAIWCGIGIIATSIISFFLFHEHITQAGYLGMALIMAGCLLLNLAGTH